MSLLRRSSSRFLLRHPGQLVLTVLGVALGVAVVVAIDLAIQSAREGFRVSTETVAGRATHQITGGPGGVPDEVFRDLRVEGGTRASAPVVEGYALTTALPGRALRVLGVDPFSERPFRPYLAPGNAELDIGVLLHQAGTVLLSESTAADAGVGPGDTLRVRTGGRERSVMLAGVLTPSAGLGSQGFRDLLLTDVSTAQDLLELPGRLTRIDLVLPPGPEGVALADSVQLLSPDEEAERLATFSGIEEEDLHLHPEPAGRHRVRMVEDGCRTRGDVPAGRHVHEDNLRGVGSGPVRADDPALGRRLIDLLGVGRRSCGESPQEGCGRGA